MSRIRLGVNIDHVATIRNARGENYPNPLKAALIAQKCKVDSITIHLREDRRHIRDYDLKNIKRRIKIPINLEMAPTKKMLRIAINCKPNYGYTGLYKKLNSMYLESVKLIMGINLNVSSIALLVRINWLPLNYVLAIQSITWIYRLKYIPNLKCQCREMTDIVQIAFILYSVQK